MTKKVIGYIRVSTQEQSDSGAGLKAQRRAIQGEADRRGWTVEWIEDTSSGKSLRRKGIQQALAKLCSGEVGTLVITKIDRVSRSIADFAKLVDKAKAEDWEIVVVLEPFDMSTAVGRYLAN